MRGGTVALTGHRALPAEFDRNALYDALEALLREGYDAFLCGMAEGFDLTALECLTDLREKYRFRVTACVPYAGQSARFASEEKKRYRRLLEWCDETVVLSPSYYSGCFLARDRYMADRADLVFAYLTKETGGTAYTVQYAQKQGIQVKFLGGE